MKQKYIAPMITAIDIETESMICESLGQIESGLSKGTTSELELQEIEDYEADWDNPIYMQPKY